MSFNVPAGFKADDDGFLNGKSSDADVYLIRVPKGFDISKLHGTEFTPSEIQELEVEEDGKQLTSVYELGVFSGQCLDVAPVMRSKENTYLGGPLSGLLTVSKTVRVDPQSSQTTPKVKATGPVLMPEGLRARFKPFGSGTPVAHSPKAVKKKKRKRKHIEIESPSELSGSTQKRKRHKHEESPAETSDSPRKKRHKYEDCSAELSGSTQKKRHKHEESPSELSGSPGKKRHKREESPSELSGSPQKKHHKHEESRAELSDSPQKRKRHKLEESVNGSQDSVKEHRHKKKHKHKKEKSPGKS